MISSILRAFNNAIAVNWVAGTNFTTRFSLPTIDNNYFIYHTGTAYYMVSYYRNVAMSTDGINWSIISNYSSVNNYPPIAGCYANGLHVIVGSGGTCVTSSDGINWTKSTSFGTAFGTTIARGVCYSSIGKFVAVGDGGKCVTSPDGVTWTAQTGFSTVFGTTACNSVCWGNNRFVAVGESGKCATSPDGVTWTLQTNFTTVAGATASMLSVCYGNGKYVAVGAAAAGVIVVSTDGITWTSSVSTGITVPRGVVYGNNLFVTVGDNSKCMSSPDGVTWTSRTGISTINSSCTLYGITYGTDKFVVSAYPPTSDISIGSSFYSADAITWVNPTSSKYLFLNVGAVKSAFCVKYNAFKGYFFASGQGTAAKSVDGINWTLVPGVSVVKGTSVYYYAHASILTESKTVVIGLSGTTGVAIYSTNDVTFTDSSSFSSLAAASTPRKIVHDGSKFIAVCSNATAAKCLTSSDGITWTASSSFSTVFGAKEPYALLSYLNGATNMVVAAGTGSMVAVSTDNGTTWVSNTQLSALAGTTLSIRDLFKVGNFIFAVGNSGKCYKFNLALTTCVEVQSIFGAYTTGDIYSGIYANGKIVLVGTLGLCLMSDDLGATWYVPSSYITAIGKLSTTDNTSNSIAYNNGTFVSVGETYNGTAPASAYLVDTII